MSGYAAFSHFYDRLTTDVEYARRADYLLSLFERHGGRPASLPVSYTHLTLPTKLEV